MTRSAFALLVLGLSASAAQAQQQQPPPPVLLRFNAAVNRTVRYHTEVDAWVRSPLLPAADTALPTMHIDLWSVRTTDQPDSAGRIVFIDRTDSSRYDMPAVRATMPAMATSGDLMRGMRTMTSLDARGRGVSTRVLETPNMPQDLPVLVKGIQGLAVTTIRLGLFSLPDRPVEPGDTWNDSLHYDQAGATGLQQTLVTAGGVGYATYRLERLETRAGVHIAVITAVSQITAGAQEPGQAATLQVSATATMDFNTDTGTLVRSEMDLTGPMQTRIGIIPVRVRTATQQQ